jgi:hypothetical protein
MYKTILACIAVVLSYPVLAQDDFDRESALESYKSEDQKFKR